MAQAADHRRDDRPFAVVDIGSNSARMIVFRLREGEHLDVIEDARAPLRLARELGDDRRLSHKGLERTLGALRDFRAIAEGVGARRITAIATSAVREATNGDQLLAGARALGIPLEIIDGHTEARLGFVGAVHDLPVERGATMDIGGGTAELTFFRDRTPRDSWTLPLGSLRVTDRFLLSDPPAGAELKEARKWVEGVLSRERIPAIPTGGVLVGIGGSVRNLAKIDLRRTEHPLPILHGYELTEEHTRSILEDLASRPAKQRAKVRGLNPDRADSIVGGGIVVLTAMARLGVDRVIVSSRGLREGIALGGPDASLPDPTWVRTISIATLGARFVTWDPNLADRRASLANDLADGLQLEAPQLVREMLGHAATILDVGRAIDYYDRFEHAAAIVTSADLAGFTHEALAVLTGILRQADDDARLGGLGRLLTKSNRQPVRRAATTLALADELNRRIPFGRVAPFRCGWRGRTFQVSAPVAPGWDPRAVARRFRAVFDGSLAIASVPQAVAEASAIAPD